jgi:DNA-binding response OmpR family regulator
MDNASSIPSTKKSILIAEDDDTTAELLVRALGGIYAVNRAADGVDALLELRRGPLPALLLLDVNMPRLDGYAVARRLREMPGGVKVPIIFLSAMGDAMNIVKGIQHGARHYLTKPFLVSDLLTKIRRILDA